MCSLGSLDQFKFIAAFNEKSTCLVGQNIRTSLIFFPLPFYSQKHWKLTLFDERIPQEEDDNLSVTSLYPLTIGIKAQLL